MDLMKLLPTWGWGVFGVIGLLTALTYLMLGESIMTDYCAKQRYMCKGSNHAFK